jgi:rhodanese-related sulfurtransferase
MKRDKRSVLLAATCLVGMGFLGVAWAEREAVNITPSLSEVDVMHQGRPVAIKRMHKDDDRIPGPYNKTVRPCPPFCIQPMQVAVGVETIGELEVLGYLKRIAQGDNSVLVIDSRTRDWVARGTIPGSVNVPWNTINLDSTEGFDLSAASEQIDNIFEARFGAKRTKTGWDYSNAKTLVLFCNGAWCFQSPTNVKTLLARGYPADKLKWYRGGMQSWIGLGLTISKPAQ